MSASDGPVAVTVDALRALDSDDWARVLPVARRMLDELEDVEVTAEVRRLREQPTGRLVSGGRRDELCVVVAGEPGRARRLTALLDDAGLLEALGERLTGPAAASRDAPPGRGRDDPARRSRDQRRLRRLRDERDAARRRLDGAEARVARAERLVELERRRADDLDAQLAAARERLEAADEELRRAVERERRRGEAHAESLREQLRDLRREVQRLTGEVEARRRVDTRRPAPGPESEPLASSPARRGGDALLPGRPTRLPDTVVRETAEGVDLLLASGRLVLVDGYNVTRRHRASLDLAGQRDWLVRRLGTLAVQRGVRPVVVFDGERGSGARPVRGAREVEVRFTPTGVTADDELVFAVEALPPDEPVLVVTDDRELTTRLAALGADVVGTGPFLWATPG